MICSILNYVRVPEIHPRFPSINIIFSKYPYATFTEENADEARIILFRPIFNGEDKGIRKMLRWIAKLQVSVNS